MSHRRPDWNRRRPLSGGTSQPSPRGCRAFLGRRYDGGAVDRRGHLRLRRDRPSDGPFFDPRRVIRPCDYYGSPGCAHHGRDDCPGSARAARSFPSAWGPAVENLAVGHSAHCAERNRHRRYPCHRPGRRRDCALVVYGFWQSLLVDVAGPADRDADRGSLHIRHLTFPGLAAPGLGRRVGIDRNRTGARTGRPLGNQGASQDGTLSMADKLVAKHLNAFFHATRAVKDINLNFPEGNVTAIIGPSGCGKSTMVRCLNRMHEVVPGARAEGEVLLDGENIYDVGVDPVQVRRRIGMVFQKPTPFPTMSIEDNVAAGLTLNSVGVGRAERDRIVEKSLRQAALWEEVKDHLRRPGGSLSGGQQQRLCVARALAVEPEVLLMDEPCSALDPISTARIEELLLELKSNYTIVIVTHYMQQAARTSDYTAFLYQGDLIEFGETKQIFTNPTRRETEDYITGRFG